MAADKQRSVRSILALLGVTWRSGRGLLILVAALVVVNGWAPVAVTAAVSAIADAVATKEASAVLAPSLILPVALVAAGVLPPITSLLSRVFARRTRRSALDMVFQAVTSIPTLDHYETPRFYDRIGLALSAAMSGPTTMLNVGTSLVGQGATLVGFVVIVAEVDPLYGTLFSLAVLPALAAEITIGKRQATLEQEKSPLERRRTFFTSLMLDRRAAKEIRAFDLGRYLRNRMLHAQTRADALELENDRRIAWLQLGYTTLSSALIVVIVLNAAGRALNGSIGVGDVVVLGGALLSLQLASGNVVQLMSELYRASLLFEELVSLRQLTEGAEPKKPTSIQRMLPGYSAPQKAIFEPDEDAVMAFEDVWFEYPGANQGPTLRGVTFSIHSGETVALVGPNGAGKSTIARLIAGLHHPCSGSIRCNGQLVNNSNLDYLRRHISILFQDFMQYDFTLGENIEIGDVDVEDAERLRSSLIAASAHEFIQELPNGIDTLLSRQFGGDGPSTDLSMGQWQRLATARTLYRRADLIVLDEPSAWLDARSEAELIATVRRSNSKARLLLTHRLGLVRSADRILVLDDGEIVAMGTHSQLLTTSDVYSEMWTAQT